MTTLAKNSVRSHRSGGASSARWTPGAIRSRFNLHIQKSSIQSHFQVKQLAGISFNLMTVDIFRAGREIDGAGMGGASNLNPFFPPLYGHRAACVGVCVCVCVCVCVPGCVSVRLGGSGSATGRYVRCRHSHRWKCHRRGRRRGGGGRTVPSTGGPAQSPRPISPRRRNQSGRSEMAAPQPADYCLGGIN